MTRTRRLAVALLTAAAGGTVGVAQTVTRPPEPAARLLPARPVEGGVVTRGYAPEPGTFGDNRPAIKTLTEQRSWTGTPLPADPRRQPPALPTPVPAATAPVPPPAGPAFANGASGVYAGPPAYRWYGYGTTTPGGNPLAPAGQYPKGSANWYAQTGATPGAFPVPVTAGGEQLPRFEPPAYASAPPSAVPTYPATVRESRPAPPDVPPALPTPSRLVSTPLPQPTVVPPLAVPSLPPAPTEPPRPAGEPTPIAVSSATVPAPAPPPVVVEKVVEQPPAPLPAPAAGLSWQSAPGLKDTPTFTAATSAEPVATSAPPKDEPAPNSFKPSLPAPPVPAIEPPLLPPVPAVPPATDWKAAPQARGQAPAAEPVSLTSQLRNACYGLATVAEVTPTGPTSLTIRLAAATEADARSAAAQAAKLPVLRPYTVRFVIELAAR